MRQDISPQIIGAKEIINGTFGLPRRGQEQYAGVHLRVVRCNPRRQNGHQCNKQQRPQAKHGEIIRAKASPETLKLGWNMFFLINTIA
ncbi:Uncharacterised protein [Vibrio cholerae]|nr:Uncharacterised protein [Vibrio cholerae]